MGLFEITRELQFRICNNGKLPANLDTARKGEYYYQREKAIERAIANSVCLSHICSVLLCESMDCSLPGSSVHGILQARITEVGCHALIQGIFLIQGSNLCLLRLLRGQAGCLPRVPPRKPQQAEGPWLLIG